MRQSLSLPSKTKQQSLYENGTFWMIEKKCQYESADN